MTNIKDNSEQNRHVLVLVRTPFQAWLVEKVLTSENVTAYDLLYFTQDNSTEDHFYFNRLSSRSVKSKLVFIPRGYRDFVNNFKFAVCSWPFILNKCYDATFLSSIDSYVFRSFVNRRSAGRLVTFDDGTANYNTKSVYYRNDTSLKDKFFRFFFKSKSVLQIRGEIEKHYTMHPEFENIVDGDRLSILDDWGVFSPKGLGLNPPKTFFIGAPFNDLFDHNQIKLLEDYAKKIGVDTYVKHPRESEPLCLNVPILEKGGKIAEEAILDSAQSQKIILVGFLSSVMFNLMACASKKIVIIPGCSGDYSYLIGLARMAGCEIVFIGD